MQLALNTVQLTDEQLAALKQFLAQGFAAKPLAELPRDVLVQCHAAYGQICHQTEVAQPEEFDDHPLEFFEDEEAAE